MKHDTSIAAFPKTVSGNVPRQDGMSLRDYFAAEALPLCWAAEERYPTGHDPNTFGPTYAGTATRAYLMADAMLKARELTP